MKLLGRAGLLGQVGQDLPGFFSVRSAGQDLLFCPAHLRGSDGLHRFGDLGDAFNTSNAPSDIT
jgi:hypothetical protein